MKKKNVLLVDDDQVFNLLNKKTLQTLDIIGEIHTARNGSEALELINEYYLKSRALPEIILLDLNMPIMDGFAFIEAFYRLQLPNLEKTLIIVVTSSDNPRDLNRAKALGIQSYLNKPLTVDDLRGALGH
jgi:CheY-like chemotaxis protein